MIAEVAPAKINLFLHVGPVRCDGLHAIESLFVFADDGDRISVEPARDLSLEIVGPFAHELLRFPVEDNLVLRAARILKSAGRIADGAALTLDKRLPVASGVGGGSADAAAALRALGRLWRTALSDGELRALAFGLGADVPACLNRTPVYVSGAGEQVARGPALPPLWVALANPRVPTPTGPIFRAFDAANPSPARPEAARVGRLASYAEVRAYLARTSNMLEPVATAREPAVAIVRALLARQPGCLISRMSGSGATVFGLYTSQGAARNASRRAGAAGHWSMAARIG